MAAKESPLVRLACAFSKKRRFPFQNAALKKK
jgi:hypothetical protein